MEYLLRELIVSEIRSKGPIPFDRFMELALYTPGLGYYLREIPVIGKEGDFFTASHLGNVFGLLISRHIFEIWNSMGRPEDFHIVEIGPGMGYLAHDILNALKDDPIISHIHYDLVEMNPHFAEIQRKRLQGFHPYLSWYKDVSEMEPIVGVIICNEILDSFPVKIFEVKEDRIMEVYVDVDGNGEFTEVLELPDRELINYIETFAPWVRYLDNYRSEANLRIKDWLKSIGKVLNRGNVIIIDYGYTSEEYYDPSRNRGTLMCYFKHKVNESPFSLVGQQDITAHVNFTAVTRWAEETGFNTLSYTSQYRYLLSLADETLLEKLYRENPTSMIQFKTLILPQGMGETHRVMVLQRR